jgi:hypothetical protein
MNNITEALVTVGVAITGVAVVALIVAKKSNTAAVIQAAASGFSNALGVAVSPVTGNSYQINLDYPSQNAFGF